MNSLFDNGFVALLLLLCTIFLAERGKSYTNKIKYRSP